MIGVDDREQNQEKLWENYLFLTNEMAKFLDKQDFDLFYELIQQRDNLQKIIDGIADKTFISSEKGRIVLGEIEAKNHSINRKLEYFRNTAKRQDAISHAYDSFSPSVVGRQMDRQT